VSDFDLPLIQREYYSIGEVCSITGLKPHVLRYWEGQFELLRPTKNRAGNRVYRPREVELILLLKHLLYDRKYTIDGARQHLLELRREGTVAGERVSAVEPGILHELKQELEYLRDILTPPPPSGRFGGSSAVHGEGEG